MIHQAIFKSYDIRGKVGTELTPEVARLIGQAMAQWLPTVGAVALGRDMRPDSEELANALASGLQAGGRDVIDIGQVTSDMIYFAVGSRALAGGAMITASHNPGADNGIKLCREEARPIGLDSGLDQIRDLVVKNEFTPAAKEGERTQQNVTEGWINHVLGFIDSAQLRPLRIAVDAGNGMAGAIFPHLQPHVPWQITQMYFDLDGTFPNHEANPLKFETLADVIARIRNEKLDGGIAFDGDGDRAFLIDETGEPLTGGVMSAMLAEYFLTKNPGAHIVYDVRNSRVVPETITEHGGTPVICRVGHSPLKQKMREVDAPFGGEASGHFYFKDNWYADSGLIGAVIGLYVASLSGQSLSALRTKYTPYAAIPETNFTVEDKLGAIEAIKAAFTDGTQSTLDGLTVEWSSKWFNVRTSNTEPLLRLNAEAATQQELDVLVQKVREIIQK